MVVFLSENCHLCKDRFLHLKRIARTVSDEELLTAYCQKKDKEYWRVLYERYVSLVYGVALKYLKRPEDARQAVVCIFDDLMTKASVESVPIFKSWLYDYVRDYCWKELRERFADLSVMLDENLAEFCDGFNIDFIRGDAANERVLQKCMESLPEKQRISIRRFFMEDRSYKEIEDSTGFPLKLIKSLVQNGKRNLKLCFEKKEIV